MAHGTEWLVWFRFSRYRRWVTAGCRCGVVATLFRPRSSLMHAAVRWFLVPGLLAIHSCLQCNCVNLTRAHRPAQWIARRGGSVGRRLLESRWFTNSRRVAPYLMIGPPWSCVQAACKLANHSDAHAQGQFITHHHLVRFTQTTRPGPLDLTRAPTHPPRLGPPVWLPLPKSEADSGARSSSLHSSHRIPVTFLFPLYAAAACRAARLLRRDTETRPAAWYLTAACRTALVHGGVVSPSSSRLGQTTYHIHPPRPRRPYSFFLLADSMCNGCELVAETVARIM